MAKEITPINYFLNLDYTSDDTAVFPPQRTSDRNDSEKNADGLEKGKHFVDLCLEEPNSRTENNALTFNSSGNPLVDFFFHVMEQTSKEKAIHLLEQSWNHDAEFTLKLIANLRDIKQGKGIRYQSFVSYYWLYENHPLTLYNNLENFVKVGYWKDMLYVIMTILFDGYVDDCLKFDDCIDEKYFKKDLEKRKKECSKRGLLYYLKLAKYYDIKFGTQSHPEIKNLRVKYAKEKLEKDTKYKTFHLKIARLFARQLKKDLENLNKGEKRSISYCAKWAPTEMKHFDKFSMIASSISISLLDDDNEILKNYKTLTENVTDPAQLEKYQSTFAFLSRKEYLKKYLNSLKKCLQVPELNMHPELWNQIEYRRVPSKSMMKNKKLFLKYDQERFEDFISKSKKISGATIKPVELVQKILSENDPKVREIYEKQWISIVESLKNGKSYLFESALAICDVSGSMMGTPLFAALGLTLLTAELSKAPWSNTCLTFSNKPQFHKITQKTLFDKLNKMKKMNWAINTNLDASFALILKVAVKHKLKPEDLPKILFIFTDMEFDEAVDPEKTNFESIKSKFQEKNYNLPTVVFWNLRSTLGNSTPIRCNESNCILISGYSPKLLSFIMKCQDVADLTPLAFLKQVLNFKTYDNFKVYD